jgi:hypothetical protein
MPSEAKAPGNAGDRLTEGGYSGRQGHVLETEAYDTRPRRSEARTNVHLLAFICQAVLSRKGLGCTNDNGPNAQEPDEVNVSSPVLKQRRGERSPRRL